MGELGKPKSGIGKDATKMYIEVKMGGQKTIWVIDMNHNYHDRMAAIMKLANWLLSQINKWEVLYLSIFDGKELKFTIPIKKNNAGRKCPHW